MAIIHVNFFSEALFRTVNFYAVVPADKAEAPTAFKTLYLLHGMLGSEVDWITGTRIVRWAQERNLVVIMPAAENKFYSDNERSMDRFATFVGEELVEFTRRLFPLSSKREDTFIAGLSMGGCGALMNGLKYHETFGYIGSFSGALLLDTLKDADEDPNKMQFEKRSFLESVFGDLEKCEGSDRDYKHMVLDLQKRNLQIPQIYVACGVDDFLIEQNREYHEFLERNQIEHTYEEGEGAHEWDFWDTYLKRFLDWLPLKIQNQGLNSGNVKG